MILICNLYGEAMPESMVKPWTEWLVKRCPVGHLLNKNIFIPAHLRYAPMYGATSKMMSCGHLAGMQLDFHLKHLQKYDAEWMYQPTFIPNREETN